MQQKQTVSDMAVDVLARQGGESARHGPARRSRRRSRPFSRQRLAISLCSCVTGRTGTRAPCGGRRTLRGSVRGYVRGCVRGSETRSLVVSG